MVDQPFQPASNRVEMVEIVIVAHITTIPRSYRVSTKSGWKNVLLRKVNRINPNRLRLKRLIPIEHDLYVLSTYSIIGIIDSNIGRTLISDE